MKKMGWEKEEEKSLGGWTWENTFRHLALKSVANAGVVYDDVVVVDVAAVDDDAKISLTWKVQDLTQLNLSLSLQQSTVIEFYFRDLYNHSKIKT